MSNLLVAASGQVGTWAIAIVGLVISSRYLGSGRLGTLSVAGSAVGLLMLGVSVGMNTLISRAVAREPERAGRLASTAILVRAVLLAPALLALLVWVYLARWDAETRLIAYVAFGGATLGTLGAPLGAALTGRGQIPLLTKLGLLRSTMGLVLTALLALARARLVFFAGAGALIEAVALSLTLKATWGDIRLTWRVTIGEMRQMVTRSLAFWANEVVFTIYLVIDSLILYGLAGSGAVGQYAVATRLFGVALFATGIIGPVMMPALSRLGVAEGREEDFGRLGRRALSLLVISGVALTVGTATFAGPLIHTLNGPTFGDAVPVLVALSLCILPMTLNFQFSETLTARNQQWRWTIVMAAGCVLNPIANLALIPIAQRAWHNGAVGAAWALTFTEVLEVIYGVVLLHDILLDRAFLRTALASLGAGAVQLAVVWATAAWWPPIGQALGVAVFAVVAVLLGAIPRRDVTYVYGFAQGRIQRMRRRGQSRPVIAEPPVKG